MSPSDADRKPSPLDRALGLFGDVRAGEGPIVLLMALNVFLLLVAYYVLKTVREPLILASGGAELKSYAAAFQALTLIGYVISFPSTSEPTVGTGKWAVGPTAVVLKQSGPTTVGVLWNQVWSLAGAENREDVSQMFLQPFVAYNTKSHWTFTLQSETTAKWKAETDKWTVPINLIFAKLSSFGPFPASYAFGGGIFAAHSQVGPTWKLRGAITILLPRKK